MSKFHKSYRIRTKVGEDTKIHVKLDQDYDTLELMSLEINQENAYKYHTSNYGVIAGRVLANESFGVPNAKVSVFINIDNNDINDVVKSVLYPYNATYSKNKDGVRYNLLTDEQISDCHTVIGTFPEKQYMLDNDSILEIFDKYYKFTTRTNKSGDYMIFGVPIGSQTIHVDIDLSDIGILSQKPRDMVYKGYNIEQFENPNKFKYDTNLDSLTHVISQDTITDVIPFWGDNSDTTIGITRCDINIQYKFEPTCVFMGSVVSDTSSSGVSKKCIPSPGMGVMEELTTGSGTIEMIRKTPSGDVEEFQIKGTQLINGDGVWCYQIPMNLDYVRTDEYGNTVPTDDATKGIPTRTRVRFRMSLQDFDNNNANIFRCKMLVPHNPNIYSESCADELDYQFGTKTAESSYRDLFWNGVYSVKSYIPRIQKGANWKNEKFTGFKRVNYYGNNNPIPYNNIRVRIPLMYTVMCLIFKMIISMTGYLNRLFRIIGPSFVAVKDEEDNHTSGSFLTLSGEMCDENLEHLCIIPGIDMQKIAKRKFKNRTTLLGMTFLKHFKEIGGDDGGSSVSIKSFDDDEKMMKDGQALDTKNAEAASTKGVTGTFTDESGSKEAEEKEVRVIINGIYVTDSVDYLVKCIEMNLAQEFKVIQFDFYNDWINGVVYIPRWMRNITKKRTFLWGALKFGGKVKACNEDNKRRRNIVQQCGLGYNISNNFNVVNSVGCHPSKLRCHKYNGVRKTFSIFGSEGGIVKTIETTKQQYVYYFKPYESNQDKDTNLKKNVRLFATDIILLGTLNDCDKWGVPNNLTELYSSTYQMPPNLALTDSDIEGEQYEIDNTKSPRIEFMLNNNKEKVYDIDLGMDTNHQAYTSTGIVPEGGNYTEIAGISWVYNGPLQEATTNSTNFFNPGGHFLGLTCRNSETTIKTCVNLTRICEHGVWMSQRHNLSIPTSTQNKFKDYATVPTGLISKDEISDTDYRRLFASMNKNKLKTIIDKETGYPVYDFEYVNPTNFNGELQEKVKSEGNMNRLISNKVVEKTYNYTDDNYYERELDEEITTDEVQIMRSGEYKDDEYFKYRFGLNDTTINNTNEKNKRFLIVNGNTVSFPMYDNSFYFYFGLHDGKTALDEFKRIYYANCEKMDSLVQTDNSILLSNLKIGFDGVKSNTSEYKPAGTGTVSFNTKANENIMSGGLVITMKDENGSIKYTSNNASSTTVTNTSTEIKYTKLSRGTYTVTVTSVVDESLNNTFTIEVKMINLSGNISGSNFVKDVSTMANNDVFQLDRKEYRGYLTIDGNSLKYKNDNGLEDIDVFGNYIKEITIKGSDNGFITNNGNNNKQSFKFNSDKTAIAQLGDDENYMIPVHKCDIKYTVSVVTYLDSNGKLTQDITNNTHTWEIGSFTVNNVIKLDMLYNNVSYNSSLKSIIDKNNGSKTDYTGWWAVNNNGGISFGGLSNAIQWNLKNVLYLNSLKKPHSINITAMGGTQPLSEKIICMTESSDNYLNSSTAYNEGDKSAILGNIKIPTINFISGTTDSIDNVKRRDNFQYQVNDSYGQETPSSKMFTFPVIYKPFFMEMGLWYFNSLDKFFMYGNVYNGITWDYKNEGFNSVTLNDMKVVNAIGTLTEDDSYMGFNEPTLNSSAKGGYNFTGITSGNKMLPYFRYNGRKVTVDRQIEPTTYGLYIGRTTPNINISIGCNHNENGVNYSNINTCETDSGSGLTFYKYTFTSYQSNNDYLVKMTTGNATPANMYILDTNDYTYPTFSNEKLNISDKLLRHIMDGTIIESEIKNYTDSSGYFKVGDVRLNDKKVFYLTVINGGGAYSEDVGNPNTISTNEYNKIKGISVSNEIDLGSLAKFYPLSLSSAKIEDQWDKDKNAYVTKLIVASNDNAFKKKKFDFKFYEQIGTSEPKQFSLLSTITTYSDSNTQLSYDLSSQRILLKISDLDGKGDSTKKWLRLEFDAYDGSEKSPTTYVWQGVNNDGFLEVVHTDKPAETDSETTT